MIDFLEWLAVPMERPKSYGTFHLTFAIVGLIVCILVAFLLRKLNNKQNRIFLGIMGGLLTISEVIKILFHTLTPLNVHWSSRITAKLQNSYINIHKILILSLYSTERDK